MKTPILFLIFNRPELTRISFASIREYQPEVLYVAADGPRSGRLGEPERCEETRQIVLQQIDWECEVKTRFRDQNVGSGRNVSEAISWYFTQEEFGVIVEDDCVPSPDFYKFCEILLLRYQNDERVMQINGFNPLASQKTSSDFTFSRYPKIWGWATWKRAWTKFDFNMEQWPELRQQGMHKKIFSYLEARVHERIWDRYYEELRRMPTPRAWDIQWSIAVFFNEGLCIVPNSNLVKNTGMGVEGTNCFNSASFLTEITFGKMNFPLEMPSIVQLDKIANKRDSRMYMKERWAGLRYKVLRFLKLD